MEEHDVAGLGATDDLAHDAGCRKRPRVAGVDRPENTREAELRTHSCRSARTLPVWHPEESRCGASRCDSVVRSLELLFESGIVELARMRMRVRVVRELVAGCGDLRGQLGMPLDFKADDEERRPRAGFAEELEQVRRVRRRRSIVIREGHESVRRVRDSANGAAGEVAACLDSKPRLADREREAGMTKSRSDGSGGTNASHPAEPYAATSGEVPKRKTIFAPSVLPEAQGSDYMSAVADARPLVDVVVVSYNSRDELRGCVEPLAHEPGLRVVIVDNASRDDSLAVIGDLPMERVELAENIGFGAGCNAGWRTGRAPFTLFLNPDARVEPRAVLALAEVAQKTSAAVVAPRIVDADGNLEWSLRRFPTVRSIFGQAMFAHRVLPTASWMDEVIREPERYEREGPCEWASGACLLVRRDVLEEIGGFDERFFMYCEDVDLCRRIWDAGHVVRYTPAVTCTHVGGASEPRWRLFAALVRSRIRYAKKHFGRGRASVYQLGVILNEITHIVVARGLQSRLGHASALAAGLASARSRAALASADRSRGGRGPADVAQAAGPPVEHSLQEDRLGQAGLGEVDGGSRAPITWRLRRACGARYPRRVARFATHAKGRSKIDARHSITITVRRFPQLPWPTRDETYDRAGETCEQTEWFAQHLRDTGVERVVVTHAGCNR